MVEPGAGDESVGSPKVYWPPTYGLCTLRACRRRRLAPNLILWLPLVQLTVPRYWKLLSMSCKGTNEPSPMSLRPGKLIGVRLVDWLFKFDANVPKPPETMASGPWVPVELRGRERLLIRGKGARGATRRFWVKMWVKPKPYCCAVSVAGPSKSNWPPLIWSPVAAFVPRPGGVKVLTLL